MFTENSTSAQMVIQIAPALAIVLLLLTALMSGALGAFVAWWISGREMRRARHELNEVRTVRESALSLRRQAMEERDQTAQDCTRLQSETQVLRRQLDQAQAAVRASETRLEELKATVRVCRRQAEESQQELLTIEEQWKVKTQTTTRLQAQVHELQRALDEARGQLNERYLTITALNAQLQEYRTRANESNGVITSLQSAFTELSRRLQQQSLRTTDTELRTNDVQFQATLSASAPLAVQPTPVTLTAPSTRSQSRAALRTQSASSASSASGASDDPESELIEPGMKSAGTPPLSKEEISALEDQLISLLDELKKYDDAR
jgi:hypothetical protein